MKVPTEVPLGIDLETSTWIASENTIGFLLLTYQGFIRKFSSGIDSEISSGIPLQNSSRSSL